LKEGKMFKPISILFLALCLCACRPENGTSVRRTDTSAEAGYPLPGGYPPLVSEDGLEVDAAKKAQMTEFAARETAITATDIASRSTRQANFQTWRSQSYPLENGKTCYVDRVNEFSLELPAGWYTTPPDRLADPPIGDHSTTIFNYKDRWGGSDFLPGEIKLTIQKLSIGPDQTLQGWIAERVSLYRDQKEPLTQASDPIHYQLRDYPGYAFTISALGEAQEIAIADNSHAVLINILPVDSSAYEEAISILKTIKLSVFETCESPAH
jgi:hypothetical protein